MPLQQLVTGEALPPLRLTAPALVDLPNVGVDPADLPSGGLTAAPGRAWMAYGRQATRGRIAQYPG